MSAHTPPVHRGPGRPPMPPGAARTEVVGSFRVTTAEADALFLYALRNRKSVREVLREFVRSLVVNP